MENEIDNLYPVENNGDFFEQEGIQGEQVPEEKQIQDEPQFEEEKDYYSQVPPDFKYTPVEIPHRVDWFVLLLSWIIIGILCYVLFTTTSVFEIIY